MPVLRSVVLSLTLIGILLLAQATDRSQDRWIVLGVGCLYGGLLYAFLAWPRPR